MYSANVNSHIGHAFFKIAAEIILGTDFFSVSENPYKEEFMTFITFVAENQIGIAFVFIEKWNFIH